MVAVCFRYDDASAKSDHKLEQKVLDIFARHRVPLCVAVIPFAGPAGRPAPVSSKNAPHLFHAERTGVIEVAMHGHSHLHRGSDARGRRTEFAGLPAAEQAHLIREGEQYLESAFGHRISGFVPPWNTYDAATAHALVDSGFAFLSAGYDVFRYGQLPVVPITCTLSTAQVAMQEARRFEWLSPVLVVVFHSDDFMEYRYPPRHDEALPAMNLQKLDALLRWIKTKPGLRTEALSHVAKYLANGTNLRSTNELTLPYRVRALLPVMLVRSPTRKILPGIMLGMFRGRSGFDAEPGAEPEPR
jgi:peptidoglycan/xylan/chitin deacetylase (PgdA/CDA1 family)